MHIQNLLVQQFVWPPTEQQREACSRLDEVLTTFRTDTCFLLKGYAGTGKTTTISALVTMLRTLQDRSVLLAPTGRAAKVLRYYSRRNALTIHKKIYRKKTAATLDLAFTLGENLHETTLFIVDE